MSVATFSILNHTGGFKSVNPKVMNALKSAHLQ